MSSIFKFIFELATEPLGLPIDWWEEYIILFAIGEIAYRFAYAKVRNMYAEGFITTRIGGSFLHWLIRLPVYVAAWTVTYTVILIGKYTLAHPETILLIIVGFFVFNCVRNFIKTYRYIGGLYNERNER